MSELKVGDKVERISDSWGRAEKGNIYIVSKVSLSGRWIALQGLSPSKVDETPFWAANFKLIKKDKMKSIAYIFGDQKELGEAFMKVLKNLGYVDEDFPIDGCSCIVHSTKHKNVVFFNQSYYPYKIQFDLRVGWSRALEFAKGQLQKKDKFFDWDIERKEGVNSGILFAPNCNRRIFWSLVELHQIKNSLEHFPNKTVQQVIDELNDIL